MVCRLSFALRCIHYHIYFYTNPPSWRLVKLLYVLWTVHLSIILGNDQLDTQLLYFTIRLLRSSTCFEYYTLIVRRLNCIDAASGIVTLSKWLSGAQVERGLHCSPLSTCAPDSQLLRVTIPDAASIQFNLLMMSI